MKGAVLGLLLLTAGCISVVGNDDERTIGVIQGMGTPGVKIQMPDAATVGQDFFVAISTGWPNSCARMGATGIEIRGSNVSITPIDIVQDSAMCLQAPQTFEHEASIRFAEPGLVRVSVRGRASPGAPVVDFVKEVSVGTASH